jgi:hypothetical protein
MRAAGAALALILVVAPAVAPAKRVTKEKPAPEKVDPPPPPRSPVDELACAQVVAKNTIAMKVCWQRILKHEPELRLPKVVAKLHIAVTGKVAQVSYGDPSLAREEIGQCLAEAIKRWEFPTASVEYDFEFPILLMKE